MDMKKRSTSKGWKILTLLFALLLVLPAQVLAAPEEPSGWQEFSDISVASYYVMDADTGEEILSHNADKKRSNASTTKIMTALILVEDKNFDPDLLLTVSAQSLYFLDPNSARIAALKEGDQLSTLDCLAALLIASANDVARVIAQNYGGAYGAVDPQRRNDAAASQELFVARMNERARELGALSTNFTNPAGFDEADGSHYTTAHDIAVIAAEAMKNPLIAHVVSLEYYRMPVTPAHDKAWWATMGNSNALVIYGADYLESQYFEKYTGVKTGTTPQAGRCLVGSGLTTDGRTLVCAALGINPVSINNMPFLARAIPVRAIMEEAARLEGV
ncbi:MAG TPA: D-alanyl-D-alanine carboxypeptidase, partial [Clostridiaceae bacterium]|nr:D-alanyl-D-alanine carboxypeptidase [Clostridiaceae bacterium]